MTAMLMIMVLNFLPGEVSMHREPVFWNQIIKWEMVFLMSLMKCKTGGLMRRKMIDG